jgi:AcrR family transcriptional regulator
LVTLAMSAIVEQPAAYNRHLLISWEAAAMTRSSRRQQNRIEREGRILDAALRVFSLTGYSGATMDAVAAEAGLTKPTLYQYFPSKESLFRR